MYRLQKKSAWSDKLVTFEIVFSAACEWPTCTVKELSDYVKPDGSVLVAHSTRLRRWPDGKWHRNDPRKRFGRTELVKPIKYEGFVSQEEIEVAYGSWLSKRVLSESHLYGDGREGAEADPVERDSDRVLQQPESDD